MKEFEKIEVILGNSNKRFSGVTSTMLQVLEVQKAAASIAVMGAHHVPSGVRVVSFFEVVKLCRKPLVSGLPRVFHARRNDEMIQALLLKHVFRCNLKVIFTSTAQRKKTWITRWLMAGMDGLLTTCSAAREYMDIAPDATIPHGVDCDRMNQLQPARLPELPSTKKIGIFGRVRKQKGVDLFISALLDILPEHKGWSGVVVGQITEEQRPFYNGLLHKVVDAGLQDQVVFLGEQSFDSIPYLYREMDIVVSLSVNEGFGLTVLEAMSVEKPVVATRAGAWPDIIDSGADGYLIDIGDVEQLKHALVELMRDSLMRTQVGLRAKEKVSKLYSVEREANDLLSFYSQVQKK